MFPVHETRRKLPSGKGRATRRVAPLLLVVCVARASVLAHPSCAKPKAIRLFIVSIIIVFICCIMSIYTPTVYQFEYVQSMYFWSIERII